MERQASMPAPGEVEPGPTRTFRALRSHAAADRRGMVPAEGFTEIALAKAALVIRVLELERENARLDELADALAHDLREGLSTITLFADALEMRLTPDSQRQVGRELRGIRAGLARLDQLVDGALESAGDRAAATQRPVDANLALTDAMANLEARLAETQATVTSAPLPWTFADPVALTRLFQNLLSNSLRSGDPRRPLRIRVTSERRGSRWHFEVYDNGTGIEPATADAYNRPNGRMPSQSGLGLAICRRIVTAHDGVIRVERRPRAGTVTSFDLAAL